MGDSSHLVEEVEVLREQVKSLVRTEAKLQRIQNDLDLQLNIFRKLHELGLELTAGSDVEVWATPAEAAHFVSSKVASFALYELNFERCFILLDLARDGEMRVAGSDGCYGEEWRRRLGALRIRLDHPLVSRCDNDKEVVHTGEEPNDEFDDIVAGLDIVAFLALPLYAVDHSIFGLLIAGNSAEQNAHCAQVKAGNNVAYGLASLSAQAAGALNSVLGQVDLQTERNLLEQKVEERTRDLANALKELEALDQAKARFFANVSHELRTPLTLAVGPVELLLQTPTITDIQRERHLHVIHNNMLRLLKLINNLLDFAKLDALQMKGTFREQELLRSLRYYLGTLESACAARKITLKLRSNVSKTNLYLDPDKFEKIVMNLLSNAFKFTPDGGHIEVCVRESPDRVEIDVKDTGIGIPETEIPKLFRRFVQLEASSRRRHEGTGLGLAMVKEFASLHGGSVRVQSRLGKGTTFTVSFRRGKEHLPPDSISSDTRVDVERIAEHHLAEFRTLTEEEDDDFGPVAGAPGPSMEAVPGVDMGADNDAWSDAESRILVVDDVDDMRQFIAQVLRQRYRVRTARDGLEGLEMVRATRPDLVVSDVMMPRMNGYELCAAIKKEPGPLSQTPVILVSAKTDMAHKLEGLDYGADDYLVKPFNANELLARARNLIKMRLQTRELTATQVRLVEMQRRALAAEIAVAREVQSGILPTESSHETGTCQLYGWLQSAESCSGDFWTYAPLEGDRLLIAVGDVMGHGTGSAMLTELAYGALQTLIRTQRQLTPSMVLREINGVVCSQRSRLSMTMAVGILDPATGTTIWSSAGHPPVLSTGTPPMLICSSAPLGMTVETVFEDVVWTAQRPIRFVVYSDGVIEANNGRGRQFGLRRLAKAIASAGPSVRETVETVRAELHAFMGDASLEDDVTIVAVHMN